MDVPTIEVMDRYPRPVRPGGRARIGEIGITGVAAAITNAIYNATGRRVRDLPITLDKLLCGALRTPAPDVVKVGGLEPRGTVLEMPTEAPLSTLAVTIADGGRLRQRRRLDRPRARLTQLGLDPRHALEAADRARRRHRRRVRRTGRIRCRQRDRGRRRPRVLWLWSATAQIASAPSDALSS